MAEEGKFGKILLNAKVNLICFVVSSLVGFFSRKFFIDALGADFLGLASTIQNFLGFLNLIELGIGGAIACALYKPIIENNREEIISLISLLGYLFRFVGLAVGLAGLGMIICIPILFEGTPFSYLLIAFGMISYMISSMVWYFVNYKSLILIADQKNYLVNSYYQITSIIRITIQVIIAISLKSYVLYFAMEAIFGLINAWILNRKTKRLYPWLSSEPKNGRTLLKRHKDVVKDLKRVSFHQLGGFIQNQASSVFVFAYVSLSAVTLYTNYSMVANMIKSLCLTVMSSTAAAIGQLVASEDKKYEFDVFQEIFALRTFLAGYIACILYHTISPFIIIWLGEEYILSDTAAFLISLHIFILVTRGAVDQFISAHRLFSDMWVPIADGVIIITTSIIGGRYFGLEGILVAPVLSGFLIGILWKAYYLFKKGLELPMFYYWKIVTSNLSGVLCSFFFCHIVNRFILILGKETFLSWIAKTAVLSLTYIIVSIPVLFISCKGARLLTERIKKYVKN